MRYMIIWELREPAAENRKKATEISNERIRKGEDFGEDSLIGMHVILSEAKGLNIVDTTEAKLAKWMAAYRDVYKMKISPIMHVDEWRKARE